MIVVGLIVCLLHTFTSSDAAFIWIRHDTSVNFVQGQTAKLVWSVDVGSKYKWGRVSINRNKVKSKDGEEKIIDLKESDGNKTNKFLSGREADIDLVVQGTSNVTYTNVTFTLRNLVKTDDMYYRIALVNSDMDSDSKFTLLKVFDAVFTWIRHDTSFNFSLGQTAELAWTVGVGRGRKWAKVIIYRNKVKSASGEERIIDLKESNDVKNKYLSGREGDTDLVVKEKLNVTFINVTFTLRNLVKRDEMYYRIVLVNSNLDPEFKFTFLRVHVDPPVISNCTEKSVVEKKSLVWTCGVSGSLPLTISWFKGNNNTVFQSGKSLNITSVSRADSGMYIFTASYGEGYPTVNKTVYLTVQYFQACSESVYELTNGDCFSVQSDGNPVPTLTCPLPHKKIVEKYSICAKDIASVSTCTIANKVGSCKFTVIVYQQVNEFKQQSYLNCSSCTFDKDMGDKNSDVFKKTKAKWETILRKVYLNKQYVTNITVLEFWRGSVIVNFALTLIANVSDPLSPLKEEVQRNNGNVDGNSIDPNSIQPGIYVPPTLKPNSTNPPQIHSVITKPSTRDKGVITGIAVFLTLLIIVVVILLVYCCYCKKRGLQKNKKYNPVNKDNVTGNQSIIYEIGYDQL